MLSEPVTVPKADVNDQGITHVVVSALEGLRYGSIEIIIHDSRIVQRAQRKIPFRARPLTGIVLPLGPDHRAAFSVRTFAA